MENPQLTPPNNRPQPPALQGSREMFDLNILPQRYRRKKLSIWMVLPVVLLLALIAALYPAYQGAAAAQAAFQDSQQALVQTQLEFNAAQANNQDLAALQAEIASEIERQDLIISSYGGLQVSEGKWSPTLKAIVQAAAGGIRWISIAQDQGEIRLEGWAENYPLVISLVDSLSDLNELSQVEISSVEEWDIEDSAALIPEEPAAEEGAGEPQTPYTFVILAITTGEVLP